jgi:hypothetical protein
MQYNKPKERLDDIMTGGIYEYFRQDNQEVVYRGSSEQPLASLDWTHRHGEEKWGDDYFFSVFRTNMRRPIRDVIPGPRWVHERETMTRRALLSLERDAIKEMIDQRQCYWNHTPDPLNSWIVNMKKNIERWNKYNRHDTIIWNNQLHGAGI